MALMRTERVASIVVGFSHGFQTHLEQYGAIMDASHENPAERLPDVSTDTLRTTLDQLCEQGHSGPGCTVDCHATLDRLEGNWEMLRELLGFFLHDAPDLLDAVKTAVVNQDAKRLSHAAHQLAGLVVNFDAKSAAAAAVQLQQIAQAETLQDVPGAYRSLEQEMEKVFSVVRQLCAMPAENRSAKNHEPKR